MGRNNSGTIPLIRTKIYLSKHSKLCENTKLGNKFIDDLLFFKTVHLAARNINPRVSALPLLDF